MRRTVVTCDRCGDIISDNAIVDKFIESATFIIPFVAANGNIINNCRQVELCKGCVRHLNRFIEGEI